MQPQAANPAEVSNSALDERLARIDREYAIRCKHAPQHDCTKLTVQGMDIGDVPIVVLRTGAASIHLTPAEARTLGRAILASADEACAVVAALAGAA